MRMFLPFLLLALCACSPPPPMVATPRPPDKLELAGAWVDGDLRNTPAELSLSPFAPSPAVPRLLLYGYPQVRQLTLPADGQPRDIAFFDVGGRVIDAYPGASCQPASASCSPLRSRFAAMSVLIAPPGTLARFNMQRASQMRWAEPRAPVLTFPLDGGPASKF